MKKLLITLRHPGPTDAICNVIQELNEDFFIFLAITDYAINFIQTRHPEVLNLQQVQVYTPYLHQNGLHFAKYSKEEYKPLVCEFPEEETTKLKLLYNSLRQLVWEINPDIALRTTPAILWGIDELLPTVLNDLNWKDKLRCYQEYYGVGHALTDGENEIAHCGCDHIAVVDQFAIPLIKASKAVPIGWLSLKQFHSKDFLICRKYGRKKMEVLPNQFAVMYAAVNINDLEEELFHFKIFLASIQKLSSGAKLFLRLHPRHSEETRLQYKGLIKEMKISITMVENMDYKEVISFPDCIVSVASALNIDAIYYQAMNNSELKDEPLLQSIYTIGARTIAILNSVCGTKEFPTHNDTSGHLIVNENGYGEELMRLCKQKSIYKSYEQVFLNFSKEENVYENLKEYIMQN